MLILYVLIIILLLIFSGCLTYYLFYNKVSPLPKTDLFLPKFKDINEFKNSKWSKYFKSVYGNDPDSADFPLDISTFDVLYKDKLKEAGINNYTVTSKCPQKKGELYDNMSIKFDGPGTINIWNAPPYKAIPSNTWVEVSHCSNGGYAEDQSVGNWLYKRKGSGIYFNTGNTIAFDEHSDAVKHFLNDKCKGSVPEYQDECYEQFVELFKKAKEQGYDSLQFIKHGDQRCGLMAIEIVDLNGSSNYGCGDSNPSSDAYKKRYKSGWKASKRCNCKVESNPNAGCLNC
jgi:hypothetical protein